MKLRQDPVASISESRQRLVVLLLLAVITWTAHLWHSRDFGLYEDDYYVVGYPMGWSLEDLKSTVLMYFREWPQGRVLGIPLAMTLAFFGNRVGGLQAVYCIVFALITINSFLVYILLRRKFPAAASLAGALAFCLFPADTGKILLSTALLVQPSLLYLLGATLCYLACRRGLAYLVIVGSVLSYETTFMPFFAAPLLKGRWDRAMLKELARHAIILLSIMLCVFMIRKSLGEARVVRMAGDFVDVLRRILISMAVGPFTSIKLCLLRPLEPLRHADLALGLLILVATVLLWGVLSWIGREPLAGSPPNDARQEQLRETGWFCAGAVVALLLAYGLTFTYPYSPPTMEAGRITIGHVAATFGISLLFGTGVAAGLAFVGNRSARPLSLLAVAAYLSLLIGFHHLVQRDYRRSWRFQQAFWTSVNRLCPDLGDGTLIFYESAELPLGYILANSWADQIILGQIHRFPPEWTKPPRLFSVSRRWKDEILIEGGKLKWLVPPGLHAPFWDSLPPSNLIVLAGHLGEINLTRVRGRIAIQGVDFPLKEQRGHDSPKLPNGHLFDYLIRP